MYNTNLQVKYKTIENELKENLKKNESAVSDFYDVSDIEDICEQLFRKELLDAFGVESIEDENVSKEIDWLYNKVSLDEEFINFLIFYKTTKMGLSFLPLDVIFTSMFNYDTFFILHLCIKDIVEGNKVLEQNYDTFRSAIEKM